MKKVLVLTLLMTGCLRYQPKTVTPAAFYQKQVTGELSSSGWLNRYNQLAEVTPDEQFTKAKERNRLLNEFVWLVDVSYANFEAGFYGARATGDVAADFLQLGLTGATTLTNGQRAKTILALVATTTAGGKASIDAHWYDQQSRSAIVAKMRASRLTQLAVIEQGMRTQLKDYPLEQGLRDVQAYYEAGTVVGALQQISADAGTEQAAGKQKLTLVRQGH